MKEELHNEIHKFDHLKRQCAICYDILLKDNTLPLPSTTGYRVCYPCFVTWASDFPPELLLDKMKKWWVHHDWEATGD